jgi:hypothetical protein
MLNWMMRRVRRPSCDGFGHAGEVVLHEGHVGGLDGGVAADGSHGDADAGEGERRGVIHAIADHADVVMRGHEALDVLDLLLGHEVAVGFVNACCAGDGIDGALVVAAEHDDVFNACLMQQGERVRGFRSQGVADG